MKPVTVVTPSHPGLPIEKTLESLTRSDLVERLVIVSREPVDLKKTKCDLFIGSLSSSKTLNPILDGIRTKYFLLMPRTQHVSIEPDALDKLISTAEAMQAGLVYSDFYDGTGHERKRHPLIGYQSGSVRDDFDFGEMVLFSVGAVRKALRKWGAIPEVKFAGLYDLRLKLSIDHAIRHLPQRLYSVTKTGESSGDETLFAYVDPCNRTVQEEMETVFTEYLKKISAFLPPERLRKVEPPSGSYPVEATVVIPVRNRRETIPDAVKSALSQETDFPFNVIVVDNHSTDGTTAILTDLASEHLKLKHIVPTRADLAIGGCWNEALHAEACGRYAIQLDSDDLYSNPHTLQKMVNMLRQDRYAMVIGSYTLVDFKLQQIPPGLIDHREWTDENGHNNALRVNGLGAPRAFCTALMRKNGFLNVSYGEDYAATLRICREYRIGRVYENLYLCRRWSGNTDAGLTLEEANRNDAFKDKIRTDEILARQRIAEGIAQRA